MASNKFSPWPHYTADEIDAVSEVLTSGKVNYWTGQRTRAFESEFAAYVGSEAAIALSNGTVAIDLALKFTVEAGDHVVVTPRTFIASVSSIVEAGCTPIFADVDQETQNISAETISRVLTPETKAIVVVHLAGMPADMDPIMALAQEHGLYVIEDCAQAHGARYKGRSVGSIGHVGAWSFCQDKIMSTGGEGGMVTVSDKQLWNKMWSYKDHGKSWDAVNSENNESGFKWVHESFGTNWRMTEMQSALGRLQLKKLDSWQAKRLNNACKIWDVCKSVPWLRVPEIPSYAAHAAYKTYVFVKPERLPKGWDRDRLIMELEACDIPVFSGSCPEVYLEKAFDGTGMRPSNRLPIARELGEQSLMFLCHPTLTDDEINKVCRALEHVREKVDLEGIPDSKHSDYEIAL